MVHVFHQLAAAMRSPLSPSATLLALFVGWSRRLFSGSPYPAARIDFGQWLHGLPARRRHLAELLAMGERTREAARQFGISPGRVSQIRRELEASWERFQGQTPNRLAVA